MGVRTLARAPNSVTAPRLLSRGDVSNFRPPARIVTSGPVGRYYMPTALPPPARGTATRQKLSHAKVA